MPKYKKWSKWSSLTGSRGKMLFRSRTIKVKEGRKVTLQTRLKGHRKVYKSSTAILRGKSRKGRR